MNEKPHDIAMEPTTQAFRRAMVTLEAAIDGLSETMPDLPVRQAYERLSELAQQLCSQFEDQIYEARELKKRLEKEQAAYQKLAVQAEYREKREMILEQAYIETQIGFRTVAGQLKEADSDRQDLRSQANRLRREYTPLAIEVGELKAQAKLLVEEHQRVISSNNDAFARLRAENEELADVKQALEETRQDRNRLRMLARNRRLGLLDAGKALASLKEHGDIYMDGSLITWKGHSFDGFLDHLAALARPVDYRTGEPLDDGGAFFPLPESETTETEIKEAVEGLRHADELHAEALANQLGYTRRAHNFVLSGQGDMFCVDCGQEKEGANEFCGSEEADENGVHLGAQITTVAEAIENGKH